MEWDDNILEKYDVFVPKRNSETTNNTSQDIQKLSSSIEFVGIMNKGKEALVDGLSYHFSSRDQFGIELMKYVFQIVSLDRLFSVKKLQKFLHKLGCYIDFEISNLDGLVNYKLQKELINTLKMRPGWINFIFGLYTCFGIVQILFFDVRKWSEYVLFDHCHDIVQVRNDQACDHFLVLK